MPLAWPNSSTSALVTRREACVVLSDAICVRPRVMSALRKRLDQTAATWQDAISVNCLRMDAMSDTLVQKLADWALECEHGPDRAEALALIKNSVLDSIGCAYIARDEECTHGVQSVMKASGGSPQATLIGSGGLRLPLSAAAFVNGTLIRALDMNDHLAMDPNDNAKLGGHPSDNLAALLAIADHRGASGAAFLDAALLSYEMFGRIYRFLTPELPWDHTTAFGFSIPAAAARMLGLSREVAANAIALGGAQSITLGCVRRGQLSHAKFLGSSLVAQEAVQSLLLAEAGVTGPLTLFEDSRGFNVGVFRRSDGLEFLTAPARTRHMIDGVTIKGFPGLDTTQAAEEAAIMAARRASKDGRIRGRDIASLDVVMNDHPMTKTQAADAERRRPATRETADHSYYYLIAIALLDGEVTPRQFLNDRWHDPEVVDLMRRMTITSDTSWKNRAPGGFPCAIRLKLNDGSVIETEVGYATGHARNKMGRDAVMDKFHRSVAGKVPSNRAEDIIQAVDQLDAATSVAELTRLLT